MMTAFVEHLHYQELNGADPRSRGRNRFVFWADRTVRVPQLQGHGERISFLAGGREWMRIDRDLLTVRRDYAWNGCTPKRWVGWPINRWVGTPDPEATRLPSGVHDSCYQFLRTQHFPMSRRECDDLFLHLMVQRGFRWARTYHGAVVDFGHRVIADEPEDGVYSVILESYADATT